MNISTNYLYRKRKKDKTFFLLPKKCLETVYLTYVKKNNFRFKYDKKKVIN